MRPKQHPAGFSMVEIMVVTLVVGITLAASVPAFSRFMRSSSLQGTAEQVEGHIKLARQRAISESVPNILVFDFDKQEYSIVTDTNGDEDVDGGEPVMGPFTLPSQVTLKNGTVGGFVNDVLVLRPDGTANQSGVIRLMNDRRQLMLLTVLAPTGQVLLSKGDMDGGQVQVQ